jgi:hypothetical protein
MVTGRLALGSENAPTREKTSALSVEYLTQSKMEDRYATRAAHSIWLVTQVRLMRDPGQKGVAGEDVARGGLRLVISDVRDDLPMPQAF